MGHISQLGGLPVQCGKDLELGILVWAWNNEDVVEDSVGYVERSTYPGRRCNFISNIG